MSKQKVVLSLVFLLVAGGVSFYVFSTTPKFALYEIVYAIKTKDRAKFEKRVDVEGITNQVFEDIVGELTKNGNTRAGMLARLLKPRVSQMVRQQIDEVVFQKAEVQPSTPADNADAMGLGSFGKVSRGITFKGLGDSVKSGEFTVTPAKFFHEASQKVITLDLKMKKEAAGWRLVQVGNLVEAFRGIRAGDQSETRRQVSEAPAAPANQAPVGE